MCEEGITCEGVEELCKTWTIVHEDGGGLEVLDLNK
jgi:hypothetical protein